MFKFKKLSQDSTCRKKCLFRVLHQDELKARDLKTHHVNHRYVNSKVSSTVTTSITTKAFTISIQFPHFFTIFKDVTKKNTLA